MGWWVDSKNIVIANRKRKRVTEHWLEEVKEIDILGDKIHLRSIWTMAEQMTEPEDDDSAGRR